MDKFKLEHFPTFLGHMTKQKEKNPGDFIVGNEVILLTKSTLKYFKLSHCFFKQLTFADIALAYTLTSLSEHLVGNDWKEGHPVLDNYSKKIMEIPKLKAWSEKSKKIVNAN